MEFFAKQPKLKCISTMAGLLYRNKNIPKKCRCHQPPPCYDFRVLQLLASKNQPLPGRKNTMASHLSMNCICRYFGTCAKYLIRRNAFFVLDFCLQFFLGPTHCRRSIFATSLFCWSWWNSGIRGADHPQVLGISGPVPAYPYDDLHLHVEFKPKVQVFSKDTANSKDQNSTQFKCVRAFTLSMVSEAFSKARM